MVTLSRIGINKPLKPSRMPLWIVLAVVGAGLLYGLYQMVTPEIYRQLDSSATFNYVYVPSTSEYARQHLVQLSVWSNRAPIKSVTLHFDRSARGDFARTSTMQRVKETRTYIDALPHLERGQRFFYYLVAEDEAGTELILKAQKQKLERLLKGAGERYFHVTYFARVPKVVIVPHIALITAALIFLVHSLYFSLSHLINSNGFPKLYKTVFWGWVSFAVAVLPLGYLVAWYGLGVGWGGFPLGWDITDNKSLLTVLFWLGLLVSRPHSFFRRDPMGIGKRDSLSEGAFAWLTIVGLVLTIGIYMIPHSIFFQ
ncbi:MAG TPA: hypothetical protein VIH17_01995 [Candidatus Acidoferrales bacterium]